MFKTVVIGRRPGSVRHRRRLAALRLSAAHQRFERSIAMLRCAALDQVDKQVLVSIALRIAADRLASRAGV
ncbi:MAG: hypothetical protein K2Y56_23540 [Methylobacterium sp.]|uniref:hypothetical protein n=1 Tax=Methylobacterium sp. TaxID=409 RepID=UPI0025D2941C|nr:hypothetical protein [Methylobacterium sp.]MBX9934451.1 hypothetical protein [Methylobacterium sp.]